MKFEFKMLPGKTVKKEPPQHPNPFELLKTGEKQKEIVTGIPISTDAFGRTLYQTPNGQFRAIGDSYNLYANVFQTQNNLVTLAPPPDDDEEDTMPKGKEKKQTGTIIIIPPIVGNIQFCYVAYNDYGERIFNTNLANLVTVEIFNHPEGFSGDDWWTNYLAMGFHNNTALVLGWNAEWTETIYRISSDGKVMKSIEPILPLFYTAKFTYYSGIYYFVYITSGKIYVKSMSKDLAMIDVAELDYSGFDTPFIWKNFIAYIEDSTIKIYDFLNEEFIAEIAVEESTNSYNLVNFNNDLACFTYSYIQTSELKDQHFIILNKNGTYKDIVAQGINGGMDALGDIAIIYYYPHFFYSSSIGTLIDSVSWNQKAFIAANYSIVSKMNDSHKWQSMFATSYPIGSMCTLSNGTLLIGTSSTYGTQGGRIIKYESESSDGMDKGRLDTMTKVSQIVESKNHNGTVFAIGEKTSDWRVYRSLDWGETWSECLVTPYSTIYQIIPAEGQRVFARYFGRADDLLTSDDNGVTWKYFWEVPILGLATPGSKEMFYAGNDTVFVYGTYFVEFPSPHYEWRLYKSVNNGNNFVMTDFHIGLSSANLFKSIEGALFLSGSPDGTTSRIYRSTDEGDLWTLVYEGEGVIQKLINIDEGILGAGNGIAVLSTNNGLTWQNIGMIAFRDYLIQTYSLAGSTPSLVKNYTFENCPIATPQGAIGGSIISKIYGNKFYFSYYVYDRIYDIVSEALDSLWGHYLWFGDYLFYTRWDNDIFAYSLYACNMETAVETKILEGRVPYFFPEHLANYILR